MSHKCVYLDEPDVLRVFPKALTADVQVVLADDTPLVATHPAASRDIIHAGLSVQSRELKDTNSSHQQCRITLSAEAT